MNAYDVIRDALCRAELIARATQLISQIEVPLANARKKLDELESARRISTELVTDEMAREVRLRAIELEIFDDSDWMERQSRAYLTAWQRELGPTLGMTAWREPTDSECYEMTCKYHHRADNVNPGRAMFAAVRDVMFPLPEKPK